MARVVCALGVAVAAAAMRLAPAEDGVAAFPSGSFEAAKPTASGHGLLKKNACFIQCPVLAAHNV